MKKITVLEARNLLANAHNNGERMEALTLLELYCDQYNPYLAGDKGGDVHAPKYGNIQVKAFDGCITVPNGTTGNIIEDLRTAFSKDASSLWIVWFNDNEYVLLDKWKLFDIISNPMNTTDLIRYNTRSDKETLRLRIGTGKRKFFYGLVTKRRRAL